MWEDLVCPADGGSLAGNEGWLTCRRCGRGYPVLDDVPTFLPVEEDPHWCAALERRARQLPACADAASPLDAGLRPAARELERRLAPLVNLQPGSKVLQVGLAGEGEIHHFRTGVRYAVDPLAGLMQQRGLLRWGRVRWVHGRGEELPFADRSFQLVLLLDVLDEVESPARVLAEAHRVLADDGVAWIRCRVADAPWFGGWGKLWRRDVEHTAAQRRLREFSSARLARCCRRARFALQHSAWSAGDAEEQESRWSAQRIGSRELALRPKRTVEPQRATRRATPTIEQHAQISSAATR